jgi:uncharacterized protein (DUF362 family)/NAD-dependent dihydropyrimidine dehydrogenase PreA subunit
MASINVKSKDIEASEITDKEIPQKFNYMKKKVAIVKLDDYQPHNIQNALKRVFDLLNLTPYVKNKNVLLKPNALAPSKNAYTPPEMINELIKILKNETGAKEITLGDSSMTKKLTSITFNRTKFNRICKQHGTRVINFFESERVKVKLNNPTYGIEEYIYLPKDISDTDIIINLPKLKTHNGYVYTGAIKNLFGLLGNKTKMHMVHKNKIDFQRMLADVYFGVEETNHTELPKVLTIMDAGMAMEGKGPRAGKPRKVGLLIAGFNPAAVDIVGYTLMNGNPNDLEAITSVAKRTGIPVDISQLEILGEKEVDKFIISDFKKPNIALLKKDRIQEGGLFSKISEKMMKISIKVNRKNCILCEECVKHCPAEAMSRKNDKITIDRDLCIECFCCGESCPNNALSAKFYLFRILPLVLILMGIGIVLIIWIFTFIISNFL